MSEILDQELEFWLPAEFLTDQDILIDNKENFNRTRNPNHFDRVSNFTDAENQLSEFTRLLTHRVNTPHQNYQRKNYGNFGSPPSPLFQLGGYSGSSSDGSPNGPSQVSSPTSHFAPETSSLDIIYQAASQVAKLKINHSQQPINNSSALYNSFVQRVREEQILKHQQQRGNGWSNNQSKIGLGFQQPQPNLYSGLNVGANLENDQTAWPSLQYMMQKNVQKRSCNGGSGSGYFNAVRKSSAGTGVFLPRHHDNNCIQTKTTKRTGLRTSLHCKDEKNTAHLSDGGGAHPQPQWQPRRIGSLCSDYEVQLAQKNAMLIHQRSTHLQKEVALGHELGLPQEWTY